MTAVVLFHASWDPMVSGGFLGVDVFFVLSGFLITSILAEERARTGRIALRRFYWNRFLRLSPAYFTLIAAYLIVIPHVETNRGMEVHLRDALVAATYLSDYGYAFWQTPFVLRHSWSLAVEEHFYLVWPLALGMLLRRRSPLVMLGAAYCVFALWRAFNFAVFDWQIAYYRFDTRLAGMLLGAWLALWLRAGGRAVIDRHARWSEPALVAGLAAMGLGMAFAKWFDVAALHWTLPLVEFATLLVICAVVAPAQQRRGMVSRLLSSAPMVRLGVLSYGIYLWHFPISLITRDALPHWESFALSMSGSTLLAMLSYVTVERLGRRLRAPRPAPSDTPDGGRVPTLT